MADNQKNIGLSRAAKIKKILLYVGVGLFFVFISVVYYSMLYSKTMAGITKTAELNSTQSAEQINTQLSKRLNLLKLTSYTLDNMIKAGDSNEKIRDYITNQSVSIKNSLISDSTGIYGYIKGEYMDGSGWVPEEGYDAKARPWYKEGLSGKGEIVIVDPYMDLDTGNMMTALTQTLCDGESVVGMDMSMDFIEKITEDHVSHHLSNEEYIINSKGVIVAHSDTQFVGKYENETPYTLEEEIADHKKETDESKFVISFDGKDYMIHLEDLNMDWTYVSVIDTTDDFRSLRIPLYITILVAVITVGLLIFFMIRSDRKSREAQSLVAMSEKALAASEAKSSFLSNMSHEIRTPINAIIGMNEMILRECEDKSVLKYSDDIKTASNTLLGLINDILDFSKIEAGKIEIIPVDYDLASVINDLVNMVAARAAKKDLKLNLDFDPSLPKNLHGDEVRLKQVITNILTNAVKYTEEGSITFKMGFAQRVYEEDSIDLFVEVSDTGIGIKKEDLEKLFSKFERIEEDRNRNIEGTGLGMNITQQLLEMMGSGLEVDSVYGSGSTFRFSVPQKVQNWEELGDYKKAYEEQLENRKKYKESLRAPDARVLFVDDNPMNLVVIQNLIKRTEIMIDTAESGDEALHFMNYSKYDMIFLDHMMPGKDGIETLHALKAQKNNPNINSPVVCLTANAIEGARERYLEEGFDDYLSKPVDPDLLEQTLIKYLPANLVTIIETDELAEDNNSDRVTFEHTPMHDFTSSKNRLNDDLTNKYKRITLEDLKGRSIVYTNDNCIGCNKCINVCSAIGASVSVNVDGKERIEVDGTKCVGCGSCIDVCVHGAREFEDDTKRFFEDLKNGEQISLLLAPSFKANYPDEYESVLGGLKKMGVNHIISVSFGADICTWGYLNYIEKYNFVGGISQPCPAVVSYIEKYIPELLPKLFPVQSPLMCAATYARKEMGITDKFAFISPCIAKKMEIDDENNKDLVQYNVTFEHLMGYIIENDINGDLEHSEIEYGLGSFYPTPGGLAENVRWFLGDQVYIRQVEGEKKLYEWLHKNARRIKNEETPFLFFDVLNCDNGCICGTAVNPEKADTDDALYTLLDIKEQSKKDSEGDAWSRPDTPEERLKNFNKQFENLKLEDYLREYTDRSENCKYKIPSFEDLDEIYNSMNKTTPESRQINCTCCGYESCELMATAIYNGFNHRDNCIYYEKTMVHELELENAFVVEDARSKTEFLANMSHELRTPINAMLGMNEMIIRESGDEDVIGYSKNIQDAGGKLIKLVDNILDFFQKQGVQIADESDGGAEDNGQFGALRDQDMINIDVGLQNSGGEDGLMDLMKIFYDSYEKNRSVISGFYDEGDYENYTIKVHALKSSARLIGATDFGEDAQALENAGKSGDIDYINEHQSGFMDDYKKLRDIVARLFETGDEVSDENALETDPEMLKELYTELKSAAEAMDCDSMDFMLDEMRDCVVPADEKEKFDKLINAASDYDYETVLELLS